VTGNETTRYERLTPIVAAAGLRSMEARAAYRGVPRLRLSADGILQPITPADAGATGYKTGNEPPPPGLVV
jgi:hypothetical protein